MVGALTATVEARVGRLMLCRMPTLGVKTCTVEGRAGRLMNWAASVTVGGFAKTVDVTVGRRMFRLGDGGKTCAVDVTVGSCSVSMSGGKTCAVDATVGNSSAPVKTVGVVTVALEPMVGSSTVWPTVGTPMDTPDATVGITSVCPAVGSVIKNAIWG